MAALWVSYIYNRSGKMTGSGLIWITTTVEATSDTITTIQTAKSKNVNFAMIYHQERDVWHITVSALRNGDERPQRVYDASEVIPENSQHFDKVVERHRTVAELAAGAMIAVTDAQGQN